jgi:hypothetical protein
VLQIYFQQRSIGLCPGAYTLIYDLCEIRGLYWSQWPTQRIAARLHLDRSTVKRLLVKNGLRPHSRQSANRFLASERTEDERRAFAAEAHASRKRTKARAELGSTDLGSRVKTQSGGPLSTPSGSSQGVDRGGEGRRAMRNKSRSVGVRGRNIALDQVDIR